MSEHLVIGIDPGASGGIAWQLLGDPTPSAGAVKMPREEAGVTHVLRQLIGDHRTWYAYLERVGATPQMGVCSSFTFGRGYGFLRGTLLALGIPFEDVTPQRWQSDFGLRMTGKKLGKSDTAKHNQIKAKAQEMFPVLQVNHHKAAALLISEWGARQQRMRASA